MGAGAVYAAFRTFKFFAPDEAPTLRQTGSYFRELVGESNYKENIQSVIGDVELKIGLICSIELILEDANRFDPGNAVRADLKGKCVGYLPKDDARQFRNALRKANVGAGRYIVAGKIVGGGNKHYGIWLDLPERLSP